MCSPHLCKYGDCKAGHLLTTQRNMNYLERRGLAHIEPTDIIALFRIVDENKSVSLKLIFLNNILLFLSSRKHSSHIYRYQYEQQQQASMMFMSLMMNQQQQQQMIMF
jgi:hypothetical protein